MAFIILGILIFIGFQFAIFTAPLMEKLGKGIGTFITKFQEGLEEARRNNQDNH